MTTKIFSVDDFKAKLESDKAWAERAIITLYAKQTDDEKIAEVASHKNSVGFNGNDAEILSSFAKWLLGGPTHHLSPKQTALAFKKLPKYAGQLHRLAYPNQYTEEAKAAAKAEKKTAKAASKPANIAKTHIAQKIAEAEDTMAIATEIGSPSIYAAAEAESRRWREEELKWDAEFAAAEIAADQAAEEAKMKWEMENVF